MRKEVNVTMDFEPELLANTLWEMFDDEQASFLCLLANIYEENTTGFLNQLQSVAFNIPTEDVNRVVNMLKTVVQYIKEGEE